MNLNKMNKELSANTELSHYRMVSKIGFAAWGCSSKFGVSFAVR
jgi:hypothetical protein